MIMKWWYLTLSCLLLICLATHVSPKKERNSRRRNTTCSGIGSACRCHRGKHYEQKLICTKKNCMRKIPTASMPISDRKNVVSLIITRQKNITSIGQYELRRLGNIQDIRVTRCQVSKIAPQAFLGLNSVERLDLHRNKLEDVPPAIRYLNNLKYLNLGGNRIRTCRHAAFFANKKLERLILGRNILAVLPEMLPTSLVKITLSGNKFTTLGDLSYMENLNVIHADGNALTSFPQLPRSLKTISLCSNLIDDDVSLQLFTNLTAINLSNNRRIGDITMETFSNVKSRSRHSPLRRFEASNSGIRSISPNAFRCLEKLRHVDISNNSIRNYHVEWFAGNNGLKRVYLSGNPFACKCNLSSSLLEIAQAIMSKRSAKFNGTFTSDFELVECGNQEIPNCVEFRPRSYTCTTEEFNEDAAFLAATTTTPTTTTTTTTTPTKTTAAPTTTTPTSTRPTTTTTQTTTAPTTTTRLTTTTPTPSTRPATTSTQTTTEPTTTTTLTTTMPTPSTRPPSTTTKQTTEPITTTRRTTTTPTPTTRTTKQTTSSTTTQSTTAVKSTTRTLATIRPTTTLRRITRPNTTTTRPITTTVRSTTTSTEPTPPPVITRSTTPFTSTTTTRATTTATSPKTTRTTITPTTTRTTHTSTTVSLTTTEKLRDTASITDSIIIPSLGPIMTTTAKKKFCLKSGEPCKFPFLYEGTERYECVSHWRGAWCSSIDIYDGKHWDRCEEC